MSTDGCEALSAYSIVILHNNGCVKKMVLTKAQDKAKDSAAVATLTNAAKECSLSLITLGDDTDYTGGTADTPFADVTGTCDNDETLSLESATETEFEVVFTGSIPGVVTEAKG